jgi:hypothetical protein
MSGDLDKEIDALFALPLSDFVQARNRLAAQLKQSKRIGDADRVKALAKPSISAWAVNQLYWRHPDAFQELMSAGQRFRKAQSSQLAGKAADVPAARDERGKALSRLSRLAASLLQDMGHYASPETVRRIAMTLEGLTAYEAIPGGPAPGRLTEDVDPPGFDALAALFQNVPAAGRAKESIVTFPRSRHQPGSQEIAAARTVLKNAERDLEEARSKARELDKALKRASAEVEVAKDRLLQAKAAADEASQNKRRIAVEAAQAAKILDNAVRSVDQASNDLQSLLNQPNTAHRQKD